MCLAPRDKSVGRQETARHESSGLHAVKTGVRGRVLSFWKGVTLPYPEPGIRLIRQDDLGVFETQMTTLRAELEEAVWRLDEHYAELRSSARDRLGRLFNPADYPASLQGLFSVGISRMSSRPEYLTGSFRRPCTKSSEQFGGDPLR